MDNNKKIQVSQQKQWRQQWKNLSRKMMDSEKSYLKILTSFSQINPQYSIKTNAIISQHQDHIKKQQKQNNFVCTKLKKINDSIGQLRQTLKYFDQTNQSLVKVQRLSEGIFEKMEGMKNQMANSYDELDDVEKKLTSDLNLLDRKIQSFGEQQQYQPQQQIASNNNNKRAKNKQNVQIQNRKKQPNNYISQEQAFKEPIKSELEIIQQKSRQKQKQVEKVDEEIRSMGKFLGWHEQDHKDFLTIWNRCQPNKTYFEIQDELVEYFHMYTSEQIIDHMNKYMKLKKLNDKKKTLINQYKQLKQQKREQQIIKLRSNQHEKLMRLKKQQQIRRAQQEQQQMKNKVQNWKKQKQQSKLEEKKRIIEQEQRRKQLQLMQKRQQQNKRKQILQKWRYQKQQKQKQQVKQVKRPQSAINKQTKERIREREEQIIRQKMQKALQKKMQQQQLAKKAERIKQQKLIKFSYVNSKLEQKTTAVKQKQRQKFNGKQKKQANTFGGQLLMTGVRAIPEWRQGL